MTHAQPAGLGRQTHANEPGAFESAYAVLRRARGRADGENARETAEVNRRVLSHGFGHEWPLGSEIRSDRTWPRADWRLSGEKKRKPTFDGREWSAWIDPKATFVARQISRIMHHRNMKLRTKEFRNPAPDKTAALAYQGCRRCNFKAWSMV